MWDGWMEFGIATLIGVAAATVVAGVAAVTLRVITRRRRWAGVLSRQSRAPFRMLLLVVALWGAVQTTFPDATWRSILAQILTILIIAASAWLLASLVVVATDVALGRYRIDVPDNRVARRIRTQTLIVRRLAIALIVIIGIGAALLTFDSVRAVGASVLASAGIASVVAGLAAQSVLANVFAGLQIVFSDALRVDDVVVADGEWGRVGEITLSYVVLDLWDDRRLVLPCTYFTTTPFENWTRRGSELLGAVEMDLDWNVSPERMREHLHDVVERTDLWDGRTAVLQVTDAVAGYVRVRILVTAKDAPTLFDLRCLVREAMVSWVQRTMPQALPVQRVVMADAGAQPPHDRHGADPTPTHDGLFTGSIEAERRASTFTNAIPVVRDPEPGR
ncbi:mechanosensitive ion channel family protein [Microbacterium sp. EYE_5]|uniref:mechanosensitive ion channel family protein n=1 Tax=unclassified Microbacterium TaxID=2609290 RepID=UPI002A023766|nr:mechanosensitive ion channel family protein [Microbacterium sp. EYE_382]MCK6085411.1 mechanosensitive ion channel family protein [Microbacterium sp. EYE_384]MCK6122364.1 mechanosensitive ion channel family protein [Microbacterium sp. EYE_80]MCK6126174.1 mechanosensitive ion channel family protein [Microbacterium sp. EYE_79]MCK6141095.1 mechanosensitive ion channel family protein [Microbacterium sp. EYE_39]MCK6217821.1 mechanosensitive ion channel family protein [Microbacterium sp. EYE_5]MC